jgi:hypothetical protein
MQQRDLREFADNLDLTGFKALSAGIGLGAVRTGPPDPKKGTAARAGSPGNQPDAWAVSAGTTPTPLVSAYEIPQAVGGRAARAAQVRKAQAPKTQKRPQAANPGAEAPRSKGKPPLGIERKLLAWGLDFAFVALSLGVLVALFVLLTAVRTGETADLFALAPVQWLLGVKPLALVFGVYALFFAYILLFKVVAGATLGETLLRSRLSPRHSAESPPP